MSNALALAGVTAVLQDLLNDGLINANVDALQFQVTAQPPDRLVRREETDEPLANRLNLFLYRVTPNTGWVNERLPSRNRAGTVVDRPYLALDLSYLLTAFGADDLQAEVLLGYGMQLLHETPVLDRERIRTSLTPARPDAALLPAPFSSLDADALADQYEQIRLSPWHHDTEEMSRLWSSLNVSMRPSATYQATAVLIESRSPSRTGPPVRRRQLYTRILRRPRIDRVLSNPDPDDAESRAVPGLVITHSHRLVLRGSDLRGEITRLRLGTTVLQEGAFETLDGSELSLDLPADQRPGVLALSVEHHLEKEVPSVGTVPLATSNAAAFALAPSFADPPALVDGLGDLEPDDPIDDSVTLVFAHPVGRGQEVELLLDEVAAVPAPDRSAYGHAFPATVPAADVEETNSWTVPIRIPGEQRVIYLLRARVDGIASPVGLASQPNPDPDLQQLAELGIYSHPVLDLR